MLERMLLAGIISLHAYSNPIQSLFENYPKNNQSGHINDPKYSKGSIEYQAINSLTGEKSRNFLLKLYDFDSKISKIENALDFLDNLHNLEGIDVTLHGRLIAAVSKRKYNGKIIFSGFMPYNGKILVLDGKDASKEAFDNLVLVISKVLDSPK